MNHNNILICRATREHATGIANLFKNNYKKGYYNSNLLSEEKLCAQLANEEKFIGVVAVSSTDKIIGFCGMYINKCGDVKQIYLANLLIDTEYREHGVGKLLENYRLEVCNSLLGKIIIYGLIHENKAPASIKLKKLTGFSVWGTRLFYGLMEPDNIGHGHLVLMGRVKGFTDYKLPIEIISKESTTLINSNSLFQREFIKKSTDSFLARVEYGFNLEQGQAFCEVYYDQNGKNINEIIEKMISNDCPYISIRLDAQSPGLHHADATLINNNFFPVAFLPYYFNGRDVIEYQYISDDKVNDLSDYLLNKKEIVDCINKKNIFK